MNILICDDAASAVHLIQEKLEKKGYSVFDSISGSGVRNKIEKYKPSLIILDYNLLFQPWEELARYLKNNLKTKHIPLVVFSGRKNGQSIAKEIGVDSFILKRSSCLEQLEEVVDRFLKYR